MNDNIPYVLSSYFFWKDRNEWLQKHYALQFPFSRKEWTAKGAVCPICDGDNSFYYGGENGDGKRYYCVCTLLKILEQKVTEYESPIAQKDFSKLVPFTHNGQAQDDYVRKEFAQGALDLRKLKEHVSLWVNEPFRWMLIQGGHGTGKSHLMSAIKYKYPQLVEYVSAEQLQRQLHISIKEDKVNDVVDELSAAPILIIDDFGAEHYSDWVTDTIFSIVNYRYMASPENYPVVMTTNEDVAMLARSPKLAISRLISRMIDYDNSNVFMLGGPDYRSPETRRWMKVVR